MPIQPKFSRGVVFFQIAPRDESVFVFATEEIRTSEGRSEFRHKKLPITLPVKKPSEGRDWPSAGFRFLNDVVLKEGEEAEIFRWGGGSSIVVLSARHPSRAEVEK